jgi:hypothetical protein
VILRHGNIDLLLQQIPVDGFDESIKEHLHYLNQQCLDSILATGGVLTDLPPLEYHPYQQQIDLAANILGVMIGTFPPISYLCDLLKLPNLTFGNQIILAPDTPYYHGNLNSLWRYTEINFEGIQLHPREAQPGMIEEALRHYGLLYADIISFCQRSLEVDNGAAKYTASDKLLNSITINSGLIEALMGDHNINRLYFTNASFFATNNALLNNQGYYRLYERDAFGLFIKGANDLRIRIEFSLPDDPENWIWINERQMPPVVRTEINSKLQKKIALSLRLSRNNIIKTFQICSAVSPAAVNRGKVRRNQCVINYAGINELDIADAPSGLLKTVLQSFFDNNIENLFQYNA